MLTQVIPTQPRYRLHRLADILCPDRSRQPVAAVIGPGDGIINRRKAAGGDDRAENLFLDDSVILSGVGDQGRLKEEAIAGTCRAAGDDLKMLAGLGLLNEL